VVALDSLDWSIIAGYLAAMIGLGWWLSTSQSTAEDYFLGSRQRGPWSISVSVLATQCSTNSILGAPAFVAFVGGGGLVWLQYELAVPLAMVVLMLWVFPALYRRREFSIYGLLEARFDRATRAWISGIFQIARVLAAAITIYGVASIISLITGLTFLQSVLIFGLVTVVYDYFGGINGVIFSDVIQMLVLVGVLLWLFATLWLGENSPIAWLGVVDPDRVRIFDFSGHGLGDGNDFGFWPMLFGGLFLYVAYYGLDQSQAQRLLTAQSERSGQWALALNGFLRLPLVCLYCALGVGLAMYASENPQFIDLLPQKPSGPDFNMALPRYMIETLGPGWLGLAFIALLAAAMSSLDSVLNALSATTVSDFLMPSRWGHRQPKTRWIGIAKAMTLLWGSLAMLLAFWVDDISPSILVAINKIGSLFNGPILGVFALALLTRRVTGRAVRMGLVVGFGANLLTWLLLPGVSWLWWNVLGALVCIATAALFSLISRTSGHGSWSLSDRAVRGVSLLGQSRTLVMGLCGYFVFMVLVFSQLEPFVDWVAGSKS